MTTEREALSTADSDTVGRIARALQETRLPSGGYASINPVQAEVLARAALAAARAGDRGPAMTGQPSVVEVLVAHRPAGGPINAPRGGPLGFGNRVWCSCGVTASGDDSAAAIFAQHQADALAAAGLLASGPTPAKAWDEGLEAFEEAWKQDRIEPWPHIPDNPYRTTETKEDDRG